MSSSSFVTVIATVLIAGGASVIGAIAGHWVSKRSFGSRLAMLEAAVASSHPRHAATSRGDNGLGDGSERHQEPKRADARRNPSSHTAPDAALADPPIGDPFGTRVVSGVAQSARAAGPAPAMALRAPGAKLAVRRTPGAIPALRSAPDTDGEAPAAILVVHPGNGETSRTSLTDDRSSWRVGAAPDADIVIPDASVDVLIGRNRDVWTAASEGPIVSNVTLDAVTLPTVPMPWPPNGKLRIGAVTMTLEGIQEPPPSFDDFSNRTHTNLAGSYAAHANYYALALARSGKERAESVTAAALACFDSRLLDPARGAALATMNMTLARRAHDDSPMLNQNRTELFVGIAGFDRSGRLRAAANFPMAVWAVTDIGSAPLGQLGTADLPSPLEVATIPIDDRTIRNIDRPLLLIAAGPDLSVVGERIRNLSTLNATAAQLTAAVLGPADTDAPIVAAAAARRTGGAVMDQAHAL